MKLVSSEHPRVLVVGGASRDTVHLPGRQEVLEVFGGAGLYTALAAQQAGAAVTMLAPRPEPMPEALQLAAERLDWRGKFVGEQDLPRFEIAYSESEAVRLLSSDWRAEAELAPEDLPESLAVDIAYCIPFSDPELQLSFVRALGVRRIPTAAGTFPNAVEGWPGTVKKTRAAVDVFFCNEDEAISLFGSATSPGTEPGKLLFVTRGAKGARVFQGDHATEVPANPAGVVDPTGAGDVFAGSAVAWLARGAHPVVAAGRSVRAATLATTGPGTEPLLRDGDPAGQALDSRVAIDGDRIIAIGKRLASETGIAAFSFEGELFPEAGEDGVLDFFFASTVLQFGFWLDDGAAYSAPMRASVGGRGLKGSDVLFAVFKRWLREAPETLGPSALAGISADEVEARLTTDDGRNAFPQMTERVRLLRAYGRDMTALGLSPESILAGANRAPRPLSAFLMQLDQVSGFKEDPLRKKPALLAAILRQRPEKFLATRGELPPIVDYHVQRSCLRMGLVRISDEALEHRLIRRELLGREDHDAVRDACYRAVTELVRASGLSMGTVDYFLFQNRSRCPEMTEPECARCPVDSACAHQRELFQPVRRVTFY
ncbi:MAG: carbohydrate kinase family protein [Thermoanaerobaculia bacterium]